MSYDTLVAKTSSIIYKPGIASSGLTVETWAEVMDFVAFRQGAVTIFVDDSVVSPAPVPAGTYDLANVTLTSNPALGLTTGGVALGIGNGVVLQNLSRVTGALFIEANSNAPVVQDASVYLFLEESSVIRNTGTAPFFHVAAGQSLQLSLLEGSYVQGAVGAPIVQVDAGATAAGFILGNFAFIDADSLAGAGTISVVITSTSGNFDPFEQPAATALQFSDYSNNNIVFRPGAPSDGIFVQTWEEVKAFVTLKYGACILYVDDSLTAGAGAHVPGASGVTDGFGRLEIRPYRQDGNGTFLIVDDGATLKGLYRIAGWIGLFADTQGAVPAFDWDYSAGGSGAAAVPTFFIEEEATIGNLPTATQPAVVVPGGNGLAWNFDSRGNIELLAPGAVFLVQLTAAPATIFAIHAESGQICSGGSFPNVATGGAGTSIVFQFDSSTLSLSPVTPNFVAGTIIREQTDTHAVEMTFLASANNVLAALQTPTPTTLRALPDAGTIRIGIEGFGGTGGGGGGGAGDPAGIPGSGGGASGGCQYQTGSFSFDLSHRLDVTVGPAGLPGAGGISPGGFGTDGTDGSASFALDFTSNIVLAAMNGSSGGTAAVAGPPNGGKGGTTYPGAHVTHTAADAATSGQGFIASGGAGGAFAGDGATGQDSLLSFNHPGGGANVWSGGAGGSGVAGGGGGGGGGQGPFADGGAGGASGDPGAPGNLSPPNSGAGAGGGGGGVTLNGGPGGAGALGWVKLSFLAP